MKNANTRAIPADFADIADSLFWKVDALQTHYQAGWTTIKRWLAAPGMAERKADCAKPRVGIPIPADWMQVAPKMTPTQLGNHYGVSCKTIMRWRLETEVGTRSDSNNPFGAIGKNHKLPDDFAEMAGKLTSNELRKHYRIGFATLVKWRSEAGVKPLRFSLAERKQPKLRTGSKTWRPQIIRSFRSSPEKARGIFDEAADVLRKYGPCHRCGPTGVFNETGDYWRYGNAVMTCDELLARAERYRAKAA